MSAGRVNPKAEIRGPKEFRSPRSESVATALRVSEFGLPSDLGSRISDLTLWQLADSAFPTGGFAHSAGLEAAWQHGEVRERSALREWLSASLQQVARAALPLVNAAHAEPERLDEFDRLCDAFTSNHVANRASRWQGKALLTAVERVFKVGQASRLPRKNPGAGEPLSENSPTGAGETPVLRYGHCAPVFGAAMRCLDMPRETALRLFVFNHLRSLIAAAVRLNIVGPMEGQAMQFQLTGQAEKVVDHGLSLTLEDLAQTAPLLEIWQGAQDRLYSRLFQS